MTPSEARSDQFDLSTFVAERVDRRTQLAAGETLFLKGDAAGTMYVVLAGRIDVIVFGKVLDSIGRGGILGEMALIDCTHRSAAALAQEEATLVSFDRETFKLLIAEEPRFALEVLAIMNARLALYSRLYKRP